MKLPRFTAVTPPPREAGLARAQDIGALTRGTAEFEAIARGGVAIQQAAGIAFQAYQNRQALDDQAFAGEADKRAFDAYKEGMGTYDAFDPFAGNTNTNDPKNYYDGTKILTIDNLKKEEFLNATYKDFGVKIKNLAKGFKNPKTRQAFINRWSVNGYTDFKEAGNAKLQAYHEELFLSNARAAASNGDMELSNQWIDIAEKYGLIGPKRARIERNNNIKEQIAGLYRAGDYSKAREVLEASSLSNKEKIALNGNINAAEKSLQTQTELAIEQKDERIGEGFLNLLINKLDPDELQLTFDMITASGLSFDAKIKWFEKLRTFDNYSEGELKEAFTDKGEVLADIYNKIDNGTLTDELDTMVGKGLSPITAERIKKEIRVPFEKDTEQFFKRIFGWAPEIGFGEKKFAAFAYEKVLREWQAEVKKQDATGEKIIEIGRSIVRPYFLEHLEREMPSDIDISRMMELALGEEIKTLEIEPGITEETGEPETYADFRAEVSKLKGEDMERAKEYYNTWIGNFKTVPEKKEGEE